MYHAHWGLSHWPFAGGGASLFYHGESQAEALARLRYASDERRHAVLVGERGVGKSLAFGQFAAERREGGRRAFVVELAGLSPRELLWKIAAALSLGPRPDDDAMRLFRRLEDFAAAAVPGQPTTLLLDGLDQAGPDVRQQLFRLLSIGGQSDRWATVVFSATERGLQRLGDELLEAMDLRIDLESWSESDMIGYIQHALIAAGREEPAFDDEALAAMHSLTDGIPRRVNRLADHALLGAAAESAETVSAAMIEAAHDALSWTTTGAA